MKGSGNSVQLVTSLLEGGGGAGQGRRPLTGDIMAVTWADISSALIGSGGGGEGGGEAGGGGGGGSNNNTKAEMNMKYLSHV